LGLNKLIIPIRLGSDPYGFMGKYQGLQGNKKTTDDLANELFKLLALLESLWVI
jgi:hypothetical protein